MWPREITLQCTTQGANLRSAILVSISLIATRKNNFSLGPGLTDDKGRLLLSLGMLEAAIHTAISEAPMDYSGSLNDCLGLKIVVEGPQELAARLARLRTFYPQEAEALADKIRQSSNEGFMRYERDLLLPLSADIVAIELTAI